MFRHVFNHDKKIKKAWDLWLKPVQAKGLALAAHSCFFNVAIVHFLFSEGQLK